METDGPDVEQPRTRGREHMLSRVLLHVVEPARPADRASKNLTGLGIRDSGLGTLSGRFDDVRDRSVLFIDDVHDAEGPQDAGVERLAARGGIKRRAIERHAEAIV